MSSHLVAGIPLPDAVGGHPALDFCNTRAGWGAPTPKEYLTSARALTLWAVDNGLLPDTGVELGAARPGVARHPGGRPGGVADEAVLRRALRLREALYAGALRRGRPADWRVISREVAAAHAVAVLTPGPDGARWVLAIDGLPVGGVPIDGVPIDRAPIDGLPVDGLPAAAAPASPRSALHAVALAAERLLTSTPVGQVAACPGTGCGWLFADPRRRRRWCSMAVCGNRAKARSYASRRSSHPTA
jgi:CGNR zinc finger/Putative stress-induced transcription regulator